MTAMALRTGSPGVRFGLALMVSLALHLAVLLAGAGRWHVPSPPVPLEVELPLPEYATQLATQPDPEPAAELETSSVPPSSPVAVPPAPTFPRSHEAPRELSGRALNTALAALAHEDFYPREAIERGIEGRVVLLLTLTEAGAVAAAEVAGTSGHPLLDAAALKAATRIGALPGGRRQVLLPVEFRLE